MAAAGTGLFPATMQRLRDTLMSSDLLDVFSGPIPVTKAAYTPAVITAHADDPLTSPAPVCPVCTTPCAHPHTVESPPSWCHPRCLPALTPAHRSCLAMPAQWLRLLPLPWTLSLTRCLAHPLSLSPTSTARPLGLSCWLSRPWLPPVALHPWVPLRRRTTGHPQAGSLPGPTPPPARHLSPSVVCAPSPCSRSRHPPAQRPARSHPAAPPTPTSPSPHSCWPSWPTVAVATTPP
jgi:hypothetical protein